MRTRTIWFSVVGSFAFAALLAACGADVTGGITSATSSCDKICDCSGCPASERQSCEASFDATKKLAQDKGCNTTFSAYATCVSDKFQCVNDAPQAPGCEAAAEALGTCVGGTVGLPGNACDDYVAVVRSCCNQLSDPGAQQACNAAVDGVDTSTVPEDVCKSALKSFSCQGGSGGAGGGGGFGGAGGAGGGWSISCMDCACAYTSGDAPAGCADTCDNTISGAANPNFCNGAAALSQCAQCIMDRCGEAPANCL
jgi:uncharacterized membrane protein YgcG